MYETTIMLTLRILETSQLETTSPSLYGSYGHKIIKWFTLTADWIEFDKVKLNLSRSYNM